MMINDNFNRRHSPNRRSTNVNARIQVEDATFETVIENVSFEGMALRLEDELAPGTAIMIEVLGEAIPAIVHWSKDGRIGVHLLDRLPRDTLIALETADDEFADYR